MHIDPNLYQGRPADCTGRLDREIACYDLLDALGISYTRADHDAADTIADCHAIEGLLGAAICKNLVLCNRQKTDFYLLLMEGDKPFRTKELSKLDRFLPSVLCSAGGYGAVLGVTPGSATILSLMNDKEHRVKLILDKSIAEADRFGCHPCINTSTLNLSMPEMRAKFLPHLGIEPMLVDLPDVREETDA